MRRKYLLQLFSGVFGYIHIYYKLRYKRIINPRELKIITTKNKQEKKIKKHATKHANLSEDLTKTIP